VYGPRALAVEMATPAAPSAQPSAGVPVNGSAGGRLATTEPNGLGCDAVGVGWADGVADAAV
jgi:hypothetical protein